MKSLSLISIITFSVALAACGGGGGGGTSSDPTANTYSGALGRATVNGANADNIAIVTSEATPLLRELDEGDSALSAVNTVLRGSQPDRSSTTDAILSLAESALINEFSNGGQPAVSNNNFASRIDETENCSFGGSVRGIFPDVDANADDLPPSGRAILVFNDCDESVYVFDGVLEVFWSGYDGLDFRNFSIDYALDVIYDPGFAVFNYEARGSIVCEDYFFSCEASEDFTAADGTEFRIENAEYSYNSTLGSYDLSATVYHEDYGNVDISATNMNFCIVDDEEIYPESGTIEITDVTESVVMTLDFTGCNEYTLTLM